MESQKSGLDPGPLATPVITLSNTAADKEHKPVKCPFNSREQDECLEQMLEDDPVPIILDPASADRFCEWHANACAEDKYGITKRQCASVSREHGGKSQIERYALGFYASNVRADCPYKDRDPKEREESLFR